MFKFITIVALILSCSLITGQNLVLNSSFEDTLYCPVGANSVSICPFWSNPNAWGTPDIFRVNDCPALNWQFYAPNNFTGYCYPKTGKSYAGFVSYGYQPIFTDVVEQVQGTLTKLLDTGLTYCGGFYTQLADESFGPIDAMGMHLDNVIYNIPYPPYSPLNFDPNPYIDNPVGNFIGDTSNWVLVQNSFTAIGGESHFVIGNLKSYTNTNYIINDSGFAFSYYYIDDVFLYERKPVFINENDTTICDTLSLSSIFVFHGDNAVTYEWFEIGDSTNILSNSDSLVINNPGINTSYVVKGMACGYLSYDTIQININSCVDSNQFILTNLISPNGDGKNDTYFISNFLPIGTELSIFNRWGNLVFYSSNYQNDWGGTYNGHLLPVSTYYVVLKLPNGTIKTTFLELIY